jgi:hypothetical protein
MQMLSAKIACLAGKLAYEYSMLPIKIQQQGGGSAAGMTCCTQAASADAGCFARCSVLSGV